MWSGIHSGLADPSRPVPAVGPPGQSQRQSLNRHCIHGCIGPAELHIASAVRGNSHAQQSVLIHFIGVSEEDRSSSQSCGMDLAGQMTT